MPDIPLREKRPVQQSVARLVGPSGTSPTFPYLAGGGQRPGDCDRRDCAVAPECGGSQYARRQAVVDRPAAERLLYEELDLYGGTGVGQASGCLQGVGADPLDFAILEVDPSPERLSGR